MTQRAVVTGASTGIGEATVRALRSTGWDVIAVARRADRLEAVGAETGAEPFAADLTRQSDVDALADFVRASGGADALVQVAGGARGSDRVEDGSADDWTWMFEANVLATQRLVATLLPQLRDAARDAGHASLLFVTSTAAQRAYPGGAGYNAAKAGESMLVDALRLELNGEPLRVIEIAPGLVRTEEFALNRLHGDQQAADRIYADVPQPLQASDVADVIAYALNAPAHVNLDLVTIRPVAQSAAHLLARGPLQVRD
jgi:NADP-dependent 3-hydroxy acid dehydrogenase YdfG